ncbi:MAG: tRNA (adenosine(37)-N6)-dimethylallyltransferase MiaA [Sulfuricurvum sp.]|nr:tRNA (adenosine(37)-N6)-dimethylallyltransferase MiaA [Sulfuricurvum sp.]
MKQLAIIGSTASGKSDLALKLAQEHNAFIFSIDSLSIYKEINIASAKPSLAELAMIEHFGVNRLSPNESASVITFIDEYHRLRERALSNEKNLIIVGGSSFYLKSMLDGLSEIPKYSEMTLSLVQNMLQDLNECHRILSECDPESMQKIAPTDAYRIEKMLLIYVETNEPASQWFRKHPPRPIITECPVLELKIDRELLRNRISLRTKKMIQEGIIDEVAELERNYGRKPNSMKAIGIVETLEFLDGKRTKDQLSEAITIHTAQLAKRQQTFNTHQFVLSGSGNVEDLRVKAENLLRA